MKEDRLVNHKNPLYFGRLINSYNSRVVFTFFVSRTSLVYQSETDECTNVGESIFGRVY